MHLNHNFTILYRKIFQDRHLGQNGCPVPRDTLNKFNFFKLTCYLETLNFLNISLNAWINPEMQGQMSQIDGNHS